MRFTIHYAALLAVFGSILLCPAAFGAGVEDDEKESKDLAIGTVVRIEGKVIVFKTGKGEERSLTLIGEKWGSYVGFKGIGQTVTAPQVGFGIKANIAKGDTIKGALFSPALPSFEPIPGKHTLTAKQLFDITDKNANGEVDYLEYAARIFQSQKHLPDRYAEKFDLDKNDTMNLEEFTVSLDRLDWWRVSRKSLDEWMASTDKNRDGTLDSEEAKGVVIGSHGNYDTLFKRFDRDKSGGLSASELQKYLDSVINGKKEKAE